MTAGVTELRLAMRANGYDPLPACGKAVYLDDWSTKTNVPPEEIAAWNAEHPDWSNTGSNTRHTAFLDTDLLDPEAAEACRQEIYDRFGDRGKLLSRTGRAPKFGTPLRVEVPFPKLLQVFTAPNGSECRLELLCDGQQFIAAGTHPDTRKPYTWLNGWDLTNTPRSELPEVDETEAKEFFDYLCTLLIERFGYQRKLEQPKTNGHGTDSRQGSSLRDLDFDALLASMTRGTVNAVHKRIIPALIWRAWHPDEIIDYVSVPTMAMAEREGLPWKHRHEKERRIVVGRIKSALKNLFMPGYDHTLGEIPVWLAGEFHEAWVAVLAQRQRPELYYDGRTWAVRAADDPACGTDGTSSDTPDAGAEAKSSNGPPAVPLTVAEWLERQLPDVDRLLGDWLTTTSRVLLSADTGLGKTNLAMAITVHAGSGTDFLHWRAHRQAKVLYIDGEMSRRLFRKRIKDAVRRLGVYPEGALFLSKEDIENFPPLNTPGGIAFLVSYVTQMGGIDLIVFDNIMALLIGDQKDEVTWNAILPLVSELTKRCIGQIWVNHTGHDASRSYGSKTKEWRLDTACHMTEVQRPDTDLSFQLIFKKAREREPDNRADFEDVTIALVNDEWVRDSDAARPHGKPSAQEAGALKLLDELAAGSAIKVRGRRAVHSDLWQEECIRRAMTPNKNVFRSLRSRLAGKNLIECDGELSWRA